MITYSQLAYWLWLFVNWTIKDSIDNRQTIQNSNFHLGPIMTGWTPYIINDYA